MKFKIIACINNNNVLGKDNSLIYNIKNDLSNFKRITMDGVVVMGRKTWESLPKKPLSGRVNVILTSDKNFSADGAIIAHSIQEVINICESTNRECYIIGGASLYSSFLQLDLIDKMYITSVDDNSTGDAYFPVIGDDWNIFYQSDFQHDDKTNLNYKFIIYSKKH